MPQKVLPVQNKGMLRDTSISKLTNEYAYENFNVRITAQEDETLLSITNERGPEVVLNNAFTGTYLGHAVINDKLIVFSVYGSTGYITKIEYNGGWASTVLYSGSNLNFKKGSVFDTLPYYETEDVQKVYWVDGINPTRVINVMQTYTNSGDSFVPFDFVPVFSNSLTVDIEKDYNGSGLMPAGTVQYLVTYYNKFGAETMIAYKSPIQYSTFKFRSGSPDETTPTEFTITLTNLDTNFEYVRVYACMRTSQNGTVYSYLVGDAAINGSLPVTVIDNGSHGTLVDSKFLLYLGGTDFIASTITHKDGKLFLGNIEYSLATDAAQIEAAIQETCFTTTPFQNGTTWESGIVNFAYSSALNESSISLASQDGLYPYQFTLDSPMDNITSFKGGEKYRFAVQFFRPNGTHTQAFWIGDKINTLYPAMPQKNVSGISEAKRPLAYCVLPARVVNLTRQLGYTMVSLMIAESTASDRSVLAQGVISPTVFNLLDRYNDAPYAMSSWIARPRLSGFAYEHFEPVHSNNTFTGEIQCVEYSSEDDDTPSVQYTPTDYTSSAITAYRYDFRINTQTALGTKRSRYTLHVQLQTSSGWETTGWKSIKRQENFDQDNKTISHMKAAWKASGLPSSVCPSTTTIRAWLEDCRKNGHQNFGYKDRHYPTFTDDMPSVSTAQILKLSLSSSGTAYEHSVENQQNFFVDETIVTLNSPDVEENASLIDNSEAKLRIVGVAEVTSNTTDYDIDASDGDAPFSGVAPFSFNNSCVSENPDGLSSFPLWWDYRHNINYYSYDEDGNRSEKNTDVSPMMENTATVYMMYLWQKEGSITGHTDDDGLDYAGLKSKTIANRRFSYSTVFAPYDSAFTVTPYSTRVYDSEVPSLVQIDVNGELKTYQGTVDKIVNPALNADGSVSEYKIWSTGYSNIADKNTFAEGSLEEEERSTDGIRMQYRSTPHVVLSLPERIPALNEVGISLYESESLYNPWDEIEATATPVESSEN